MVWLRTPSLCFPCSAKTRDSSWESLPVSPFSEPAKMSIPLHVLCTKNCLVSWTLFMFRCTLMADASFCNYWTVLIVKIKCIQTKNKKKNKNKKKIITEQWSISCFSTSGMHKKTLDRKNLDTPKGFLKIQIWRIDLISYFCYGGDNIVPINEPVYCSVIKDIGFSTFWSQLAAVSYRLISK